MQKILYFLLTTSLAVAVISMLFGTTNRIAGLATVPVLFDGAVGGTLIRYENSTIPQLYYISNYTTDCTGIWSCSKLICDLYAKDNAMYVAIKPNAGNISDLPPCSKNIDKWLNHWPEYQITYYSIVFSWTSVALSIILSFLLMICKCGEKKFEIIINEDEEKSYCKKYALYGVLFLLRCPVYVSVILLYTYLIPKLPIDNPPFQIQNSEYIKTFSLLIAYTIDNFLFPYEILN